MTEGYNISDKQPDGHQPWPRLKPWQGRSMCVGVTYSTRSYAASQRRAPALFSSSVDCWFQAETTFGSPPVTDDFGSSRTTFLRSPHLDSLTLPHAPLWGRISPPLGVRSTFFGMPGLHRILTADDKTMRATLLLLIKQSIRGVVRNIGGDERMSLAKTTDFVVNVLVTALSKLASLTSAQISH